METLNTSLTAKPLAGTHLGTKKSENISDCLSSIYIQQI